MITILLNIPNINDSTSLYRGMGVMPAMRRAARHQGSEEITFASAQDVTWATLKMVDVVFMQRPFRKNDLMIAQMAKDNQKPLWVDYDDLLFALPESNPAFNVYMNKQVHENMIEIIRLADVVTVSTPFLKTALQKPVTRDGKKVPMAKNVIVVPNAFDDELFKLEPKPSERTKLINWRGSNTHFDDLAEVAVELIEASEQIPDHKFSFIGWNPWFITSRMKKDKSVLVEMLDPIEYMRLMKDLAPRIQIVPLQDSIFNRAKSNIAWIEATHAGAVTIAPDMDEWKRPGIINYKTPEDLKDLLIQVTKMKDSELNSKVNESIRFIRSELLLSQNVSEQRLAILSELLNGDSGGMEL